MTDSKTRALITGASAGLGAEYARALAKDCEEIVLVARREDRLQTLAKELQAQGVEVHCYAEDLSETIGIAQIMEIIRQKGPFTYLVNNAGFSTLGPFAEQDPASQETMVNLHINAVMQLSLAALGGMKSIGRGYIINVSSLTALLPYANVAVYSGTKAFLNGFSQALQQEVAAYGIKVQALCPGYMHTEFHTIGDFSDFDKSQVPEALWMQPEEVVADSLAALKGDKVVVISGEINKDMAQKGLQAQLEQLTS